MTQIKVNTDELRRMLKVGVITAADWANIVNKGVAIPLKAPIETLTLRQFVECQQRKTDYDLVCYVLECLNYGRIKLTPKTFIGYLKTIATGLKEINNLFAQIPQPVLTDEERQAGYNKLNFGVPGLVDRLARRQGITDTDVENMSISRIIGKMLIDSKTELCNRRFQEIQRQKNKTRVRR